MTPAPRPGAPAGGAGAAAGGTDPLPAPAATPHGLFTLRPVRLPRDLELLAAWMNDPEVDAFWELAGSAERTAAHVRAQQATGHSRPCVALLDGAPVGYFEIYRADLDPLAAHYPARPHDAGVHLLLGPAASRGRGLGTRLLDSLAAGLLAARPECGRVVAEPDVRNTRSVAAFTRAGFARAATLALPDKQAALMVRARGAVPAARTTAKPPPDTPAAPAAPHADPPPRPSAPHPPHRPGGDPT